MKSIKQYICKSEPIYTYTFICTQCGSKDFYRKPEIGKHCKTFLEGFFNCSKCDMEHSYSSQAFSCEIPTKSQLILNFTWND